MRRGARRGRRRASTRSPTPSSSASSAPCTGSCSRAARPRSPGGSPPPAARFDPATDGPARAPTSSPPSPSPRRRAGRRARRRACRPTRSARCAALAVGFTELLRAVRPAAAAARDRRVGRAQPAVGPLALRVGRHGVGRSDGAAARSSTNYREPAPDVSAPLGPSAPWPSGGAATGRRSTRRPRRAACLLRSFVWPDQADRHERLDAALAVAAEVPATVDAADAGAWVAGAAGRAGRRRDDGRVPLDRVAVPARRRRARASLAAVADAGAGRRRRAAGVAAHGAGPGPGRPPSCRLTTGRGGDERLLAHRLPRPPRLGSADSRRPLEPAASTADRRRRGGPTTGQGAAAEVAAAEDDEAADGVEPEVVGGHHDAEQRGDRVQRRRAPSSQRRRSIGASTSADHVDQPMCRLGIAAYWLETSLSVSESNDQNVA